MTYVATGEVTTLEHELGDDAVEGAALVVEGLARAAGALLAGAERAEVLGSLEGHHGQHGGVRKHGEVSECGAASAGRNAPWGPGP